MDKVKIKDVCDILNGFAFKSDNYVDKGIRIIRIANVQKGYIEDSTPAFYPLNSTGLDKYMLDKGDLLISLTGNVGRVAILQEEMLPAALNQRVACLRIKSDKISKGYLFHILNSDFFERKCIQSAKGVAQKNMSTEWLKNYKIPLYSTEQQSEIVSVLDTLQSIICNRKYELQMLNNLIKARFIELFGDPQCNPHGYKHTKLSDIATYYNGLTYKPENVAAEGTIVLRSSNIQNSQLNFADTVRVDCAIKERLMVQKNDILMCSRNGSAKLVGKVALIKDIQEPMSFGAFMMIIRSHYFRYLMTYFQMDAFRQQIKTGATTTINQITGRMLDDVTIPLPPMSLVDQFATFVEQTDKSKLLSGCRFFHSWVPANRDNLNHVGAPRRRTKDLRGIRRQHAHLHH